MDIFKAKSGDIVICKSDYQNYYGGCEEIKEHLKVGNEYTIEEVDIHSWHTNVYLEGFPGLPFNSVHFELKE